MCKDKTKIDAHSGWHCFASKRGKSVGLECEMNGVGEGVFEVYVRV